MAEISSWRHARHLCASTDSFTALVLQEHLLGKQVRASEVFEWVCSLLNEPHS